MFKQLLTFLLAGMLVLETPITAYAVGQNLNQPTKVSEVVLAGVNETNEDGNDTDNVTGGQSTGQADDESDEVLDGKEDTEKESNLSGETGNEETDFDDENDTGEGDGSWDETLDDSAGEVGDNKSGENSSDEAYGADEGYDPSEEIDGIEEGVNPSEETDRAEDGTDLSNEIDNTGNDADSSDELEDTISSNSLMSVQSGVEVKANNVTEISYEEAVGTGVEITAPYDNGNAVHYSFTAPADGRYVFYTEEMATSSGYIFFVVSTSFHNSVYSQSFTKNQYFAYMTDYMRQGDTVKIRSYAQTAPDDGYTYTIKMAAQTSMIDLEDGNYSAVLPDGQNIVINAEEGIRHLRFRAKSSEGKWMIRSFYRTAEGISKDIGMGDRLVETTYGNTLTTVSMLEQGTTYDIAYMVFDSNNKFVAVFTNILTTKTSDTGEDVYIHSVKTDVDHQITLDVEYIGEEGETTCYYTAEGTSSPAGSCKITGWVVQTFTDLKAGSRYLFEFLGIPPNNELLLSAEYITSGSKVDVTVDTYLFEVSEDFQTMTIGAKVSHNQVILSKEVIIHYEFVDAIGVKREGKRLYS